MIFSPHFFISLFISMVSLAHYKIDYKSPLTLYPRCRSWVVVSSLLYPRHSITPHPCRQRRRILVVYRRYNKCFCIVIIVIIFILYRHRHRHRCIIVVVVVVVSSLYPLPLSYWPIWPCLSFSLVMFVRCHDLITKRINS